MSAPEETTVGSKGRRRGGPLRIDRSQIINAAKNFDPQTMTMQAVADELGVDRKALNYHVTDRDGLLRLVAADVFESHFETAFRADLERADRATQADWRNAVHAWAVAVRDSMVATGVVTNYYRISGDNPAIFEPVELVLQRMLSAGFDQTTSSRGLIFLTRFAMGVGRDIVMERQIGEHPQRDEVRRVLTDELSDGPYKAMRWMMDAELNGPTDIEAQFEFEVDTFIAGMERLLAVAAAPATR